MITEIAVLFVKENEIEQFESDFREAGKYIIAIPGYIKHNLHKCMEVPNKYVLIVEWEKLEDHTVGFRQSTEYLQWKRLLHHHYNPFPVVEHFSQISL
ncbi:heme-degrading monooxygenase HmoA [Pedobacter sp. CAN_A7]|uniref:antibiotic biosynthesis monooxygenase family protein n=1 Tax=Pedobacter sp. CAN_A7 TaxID=2787722 RepID=UPI0018CB43BB